jgi:hypothetical protein
VDVVDDTFVRARPTQVRALTRDRWDGWLGGARGVDLALSAPVERGAEGVRWTASAGTGRGRGRSRWSGTAEVWLEPAWGGTVVHLYVRLDPVDGAAVPGPPTQPRPRHARVLPDRLRRAWKRGLVHAVDTDPRLRGEEP